MRILKSYYKSNFTLGNGKVFCVGLNKTGTTSMAKAFTHLGYKVAPQQPAELMLRQWIIRDFRALFNFCQPYGFFQDVPFSLPYTYIALDQVFPGSKFILTIRDDPEQWVHSLLNFHKKMFGDIFNPLNWDEIDKVDYAYPGWLGEIYEHVFKFSREDNAYDVNMLMNYYSNHNNSVVDYFSCREKTLLVLKLSEGSTYQKLASFLNLEIDANQEFPAENVTGDI